MENIMLIGMNLKKAKGISIFVALILVLGLVLTSLSYVYANDSTEREISVFLKGYLAGKVLDKGGKLLWKGILAVPPAGIAAAIAIVGIAGASLVGLVLSLDGTYVDYGYDSYGCIYRVSTNQWDCLNRLRPELVVTKYE